MILFQFKWISSSVECNFDHPLSGCVFKQFIRFTSYSSFTCLHFLYFFFRRWMDSCPVKVWKKKTKLESSSTSSSSMLLCRIKKIVCCELVGCENDKMFNRRVAFDHKIHSRCSTLDIDWKIQKWKKKIKLTIKRRISHTHNIHFYDNFSHNTTHPVPMEWWMSTKL